MLIARNVRARRIKRRMSQQALADKIGVTFQQIQKYETGADRVSAGCLRRAADALGVSVVDFFRDASARY